LIEYWPTIPAAVAIIFSAGLLVNFLNSAFLKAANGLDRYCTTQFADIKADIFQHSIESSAYAYDPVTNRTTVTYTVTSGTQPAISHWILGVPKAVADRVLATSESWVWSNPDPTTGAVGMKFDTGYTPTGGTGTGSNMGNGGGKKSSHKRHIGPMLQTSATEVRFITVTLDGPYEFGNLTVTLKAGSTQIATATVSGPVAPKENTNTSGGVDRSKGC
jgi:hypothetical protein